MKKRKGLTLIELIISIAIIGIIAIAVLGIFSTGTRNIVRSDARTINTLKGKDKVDDIIIKLQDSEIDPDSIDDEDIEINKDEFSVILPGIGSPIKVQGKIIKVTSTDEEGNIINIETFVPERLESGESEGS